MTDAGATNISVDVYAMGMCALEMAALEICGNGETPAASKESVSFVFNHGGIFYFFFEGESFILFL